MQTLLVANRGEIARRIFRTARRLGIRTVAVHSDPDATAPFVREADLAVALPGQTAAQTYLDAAALLRAARAAGADAVHPGYGFLAENPDFAQAVIDAGLIWVGPTPGQIRAMALKVQAKRIAAAAGVPLLPGAELGTDDDASAAADTVGYPLLVKASAGGGGKGMRAVESPEGLAEAVQSARREAASAFGDDTVFLERLLTRSRHVEVQVFGDAAGTVVHLGERECSIQRRHQKIVEEAPSPAITARTREAMCTAAVDLARAIGYVGAGTVEFLVSGSDDAQEFFFLEMNTRLQVEHPVTEAVMRCRGQEIDLVEWQLRIAQGEVLGIEQSDITAVGHAIEVRLYAEDPTRGYLPGTGTLRLFASPEDGVRIDSAVETGSEVTAFYDPMLAKVIAHAATRAAATDRLAAHLRGMRVHGLVTNRDSLVATLTSPHFKEADTTTDLLDRAPSLTQAAPDEATRLRHLLAAALGALTATVDAVPPRWRHVPGAADTRRLIPLGGGELRQVTYQWQRGADGGDALSVALDGKPIDVRIAADADTTIVGLDGVAARLVVTRYAADDDLGGLVCVDEGVWCTQWVEQPRFPSSAADAQARGPMTPVPGTVTVVSVAPGDAVRAGETLVVVEAMKMEHRITAETDGVVSEVLVAVGQAVDAHAVLVVLEAAP